MKEEKGIFRINDKVHDAQFGWGIVFNFDISEYPVIVNFKSGNVESYTEEGFYSTDDSKATLSFTEYDFVNGGFSQNRNDIDKHLIGKLGFFWNNTEKLDGSEYIRFGLLKLIKDNRFTMVGYISYDNFSLECPIKLSENKI